MVRQAHHERNQRFAVRPEPVEGSLSEGLIQGFLYLVGIHISLAELFKLYGRQAPYGFIAVVNGLLQQTNVIGNAIYSHQPDIRRVVIERHLDGTGGVCTFTVG